MRTAVLLVLMLALPARAVDKPDLEALKKQGAQALLEALDKRHNDYPTQKWTFKMVLKSASGDTREMTFSTWQKNKTKRLTRFLEPGEVKGMSVLIAPGDAMYVYSPQTDNVRRVALSARRQTFMGSDLTFDDMSQVDFAVDYDATLDKEDGKALWLDLKRKAGREIQWEHLRLKVDKEWALIETIEYYDGGKHVKTQQRGNPAMDGKIPHYKLITVTDLASKHKTELHMLTQVIGDDIPDSVFSKRSLVRGN